MNDKLLRSYRFHKEHGGWIVGRKAECALAAARAELLLDEAVAEGVAAVQWRWDDMPWDEGTEISAEEAEAKFASGEWFGPLACVLWIGDDLSDFDTESEHDPESWTQNASLWGIVVGSRGIDDPYCRTIVADLALEVEDDLRQALGDARDAAQPSLL